MNFCKFVFYVMDFSLKIVVLLYIDVFKMFILYKSFFLYLFLIKSVYNKMNVYLFIYNG